MAVRAAPGLAPRKGKRVQQAPGWRQAAFERFSSVVEVPLLIMAVAMIPLIVVPLVVDLPSDVADAFLTADYFIWAVFAVEYAVKVSLAPNRWHFFTHTPLDFIIVVVPMLRPLRIMRSARALRLARLTRLGAFFGRGAQASKRSLHVRGVGYVLVVTMALVMVLSLVVYDLERTARGSSIHTWSDALWWAVSTVTTVGYGDKVPVTGAAKGVAVVLMLCGIALLGVITASLATFFVSHSEAEARKERADAQDERMDQVLERLAAIESSLASLQDRSTVIGHGHSKDDGSVSRLNARGRHPGRQRSPGVASSGVPPSDEREGSTVGPSA
jgi:voltage-gated potassium channel